MLESSPSVKEPEADVDAGQEQILSSSSEQKIACYDSLDSLPNSARQLLEEEEQERFFNGLSWYDLFCRTCLDPGQKPAFYHVTSADPQRTQLILPMSTPLGRSGCRVSDQQLDQNSCMSMTNYQSAYYGPITNQSGEILDQSLERIAQHLRAEHVHVVEFNHLDPTISANQALRSAFERAGFKVLNYLDEPIVLENVDGLSYVDYMATRTSNLRKNIKRRRSKLEAHGKVRFVLNKDRSGLDEAIADYQNVQGASWKPDETYPDHVPELIRIAAENGNLRLGILYLDDHPVATDLTILSNDHATSKKAHYDQSMREHHVGDVLTSYMIEYLLDVEKIKSIDLGKTAAEYKVKWARDQRPMQGFAAFNPSTIKGQYWWFRVAATYASKSVLSKIKSRVLGKSA